jgi:LSD1 subclass zinc finger protein
MGAATVGVVLFLWFIFPFAGYAQEAVAAGLGAGGIVLLLAAGLALGLGASIGAAQLVHDVELGLLYVGTPAPYAGCPLPVHLRLVPKRAGRLTGATVVLRCVAQRRGEKPEVLHEASAAWIDEPVNLSGPWQPVEGVVTLALPPFAPASGRTGGTEITWHVLVVLSEPESSRTTTAPVWVYPQALSPEALPSIAPRSRERTCPYCRDELPVGATSVACAGCNTSLHPDCYDELGRCSTLGCGAGSAQLTRA